MHKLIINIFVRPKIMINSQEVCFDITRQCAQVGHKTQIFVATKIIKAVSAEMENNLYKKIYCINLCKFWHRS
jgi:hypothetical protein